jgi:ATP-dependent DNA ligase
MLWPRQSIKPTAAFWGLPTGKASRYSVLMPISARSGFVPPCIPARAYEVPSGPGWVHEIKHDGYRLQVRRDGEKVRLFTTRGYDWSKRYPAIARTAAALRYASFTIDGEAVVCGPDGVAVVDALHRRGTVSEPCFISW